MDVCIDIKIFREIVTQKNEYRLLAYLIVNARYDGSFILCQKEVAKELGVHRTTISRYIDLLSSKGLISVISFKPMAEVNVLNFETFFSTGKKPIVNTVPVPVERRPKKEKEPKTGRELLIERSNLFADDKFFEVWNQFKELRRSLKSGISATVEITMIKEIENLSGSKTDIAIEFVEKAINERMTGRTFLDSYLLKEFTKVYRDWYIEFNHMEPPIRPIDKKSLKDTIYYFLNLKKVNGNPIEAINRYKSMLSKWKEIPNEYIRNGTSPTAMYNNLSRIITELKNSQKKNEKKTTDVVLNRTHVKLNG